MKVNRKDIVLVLGVLVAALIGVHFYLQKRRREKDELLALLYDAIDNDRGLDGTLDFMTALMRTKPDVDYDGKEDAKKLWEAQGNFLAADNADQVFAVLQGKTPGQLVVINGELERGYGKDLGQYIKFLFDKPWEADSRSRAETMLKSVLT